MQNLKVTFKLSSPLILDRLTTIDGILLNAYYSYAASQGKKFPFDGEHKKIDFIHKQNGVFSGSIWYVSEDAHIDFDFMTYTKKSEHRKIFDLTKRKTTKNASFKGFIASEEILIANEIYFYIKAKKEIVKALLANQISSLGKKQSIGYGEVEKIKVEEIDEDYGYMLNETTASKPLPIKDFEVKSKKVAQMRPMPPYWLEEGSVPCYMPTTSLVEKKDESFTNENFDFVNIPYQHNCDFIYNHIKYAEDIVFKDVDLENFKNSKKSNAIWVKNNTTYKCAITNKISPIGMQNTIRNFIYKWRNNFADYTYIKNDDFLSKEALWCICNMDALGYTFINKDGLKYLQTTKAKEGSRYNDVLKNPKKLKPPFSINLKDTQNAQHISFKGKVSISDTFFIVQYGNTQLYVDNELLQEAIKEIEKITSETHITKTHLCGNFKDLFHPLLKKSENNVFNRKIINNFMKKYNKDIRFVLSSVDLNK